ncbi:hypothetical protein COOONC_25606 [Cooperia oncophora]
MLEEGNKNRDEKRKEEKTIADIKIAKNAGKSKAEVMDIGYTTIAGQVTKALMEKLCNTLIPANHHKTGMELLPY